MSYYNLSSDRKRIKKISNTTTIDVADCGTYFLLQANNGGNYTITLPEIALAGPGWWCRFYVQGGSSGAIGRIVTIAANATDGPDDNATDLMKGIIYGEASDFGQPSVGIDDIKFLAIAKKSAYISFMTGPEAISGGSEHNRDDQFWYITALSDEASSIGKTEE
jgi:hypothetical protein